MTIKINDPSKSQAISRTAEFPEGINITLKTIPQKNAKFLRWEDGSKKTISTKSLYVMKMGASDVTYKAVYESNIKEVEEPAIEEPSIEINNDKKELVASEAKSYQWYFNNAVINGATASTLSVTNNGTYSVEMTLSNGKKVKLDICVTIGKDGTIRRIYLVGDSTVCDYKDSQFPMTGWGQVLKYFFNGDIKINNHAIGGRSSRSFREQGRWKTILKELQPGDFVFIQFGHNDRDSRKAERYTPVDKYKLYIDSFVVEARSKGAIPVLVSPMVMNAWNNSGMRNVFTESGNNYQGAMEEVAKSRNCAYVNLGGKSHAFFGKTSSDYCSRFFYNTYVRGEYTNYPDGQTDGTHFQEMGALILCRIITEELKANKDPFIQSLVHYMKPLYEVTVKANIDNPGSITLSGAFPEGAPVTMKVLPANGKKFLNWNQSGKNVSNKTIYRFVLGNKNTTLTAMFEGGSDVISDIAPLPTEFPSDKLKIAYVTDPTNANYSNDKIEKYLKEDENLFVWETDAKYSEVDLTMFDMVVISENTPSTASIMNDLKSISKPTLTLKVHGYKTATGAWNWAKDGFGDNTTATTIVVEETQKSHPIFKDVTFTGGNEIEMVTEVNTKALTFMNPASFTNMQGVINSIASIKDDENVTILEINEGSSINGDKINKKLLQIGLNSSSYGNLTDNELTLIKNSCYYLAGKEPVSTNLNVVNSNDWMIAPTFVSDNYFNIIGVASGSLIQIINSKGQIMQTNILDESGIITVDLPSDIYFVRINGKQIRSIVLSH